MQNPLLHGDGLRMDHALGRTPIFENGRYDHDFNKAKNVLLNDFFKQANETARRAILIFDLSKTRGIHIPPWEFYIVQHGVNFRTLWDSLCVYRRCQSDYR